MQPGEQLSFFVRIERNTNCIPLCHPDSNGIDSLYIYTEASRFNVLIPCVARYWGLYVGPCGVKNEEKETPPTFALSAFPNPFNPSTVITFDLPSQSNIQLSVFDLNGKRVELLFSGNKTAGKHSIIWNATKQSSGIYLLKLEAGNEVLTRKMTLVK
jgi:hypothetical protein